MPVKSVPHIITDAIDLKQTIVDYLEHPAFAFDLETIGRGRGDPRRNRVTVLGLATSGRHDVIPIRFPHGDLESVEYPLTAAAKLRREECEKAGKEFRPRKNEYSVDEKKAIKNWKDVPPHLSEDEVWPIVEPLLMSDRLKVGHNLKFDVGSMHKTYKAFPPPPYGDTMVAAYLLNSGWAHIKGEARSPYGLGSVVRRETSFLMEKGVGENVDLHPWSTVMAYSATDVKWTWLAWRMLSRKLKKQGLQSLMDLEMQVLEVLLEMERVGAPIDRQALVDLDERMTEPLNGLIPQAVSRIVELVGYEFPLGSIAKKAALLYDSKEDGGQGLKCKIFTGSGKESVSADAIKGYRNSNKLVAAFMDHADLEKLHSTYVRPYLYGPKEPEGCRPEDRPFSLVNNGRIHADFNQIGAETGRFSCRAPNLQNVPSSGTEMGKAIRGLFIAPPGGKLIVADFANIELRVLAHLCEDPRMVAAFRNGENIHQSTADALGITYKAAKALNFCIVFGGGPYKVAEMAGCGVNAAKDHMNKHEDRYPGIGQWKYRELVACRRREPVPYVETLAGRRRFLPDLLSQEDGPRAAAERRVANTKVQGSAADIIKWAMVRAHRALPEGCHLVLSVHDELVTTAPAALADEAAAVITSSMQGAFELLVPMPADVKVVDRWSDAK